MLAVKHVFLMIEMGFLMVGHTHEDANYWEKFWMCNDKDLIRWEHRDSIVWSWTPKEAQGKKGKKIKIPQTGCEKVQASLVVGG